MGHKLGFYSGGVVSMVKKSGVSWKAKNFLTTTMHPSRGGGRGGAGAWS